jgi:iron complex transport system ATP-binding protein
MIDDTTTTDRLDAGGTDASTDGDGSGPARPTPAPRLRAEHVRLAYDDRVVVDDLSFDVPSGAITVIVGPNACGKSTLLRALARLLTPTAGTVLLDGEQIRRMPTRVVAQRLGILPQQPIAPDGITVADLVGRGRHPHQHFFRQWSTDDEAIVTEAMEMTGTIELAERSVDELSGGQRQRAWIAMALAQGTEILLLDEPTTFLDLTHQVEVLDLLTELNDRSERTIVCVLHDLNLACRYADHLVTMKDGRIVAEGPPGEVITEASVLEVFDLEAKVIDDPVSGTPMIVPIGRHGVRAESRGVVVGETSGAL